MSALTPFAVEYVLKDATGIHLTDMVQLPEMSLTENGKYAWDANAFKEVCIGHSILSRNAKDVPETAEVDAIKPLFLTGVCCPGLIAIWKCVEHTGLV